MIETAEIVAERYGISRERQDEYALESQQRTAAAQAAGKFKDEIVPLATKMKKLDKATRRRKHGRRHGRSRRMQPSRHDAGGACGAQAGACGRPADRAGQIHHRRQCLAIRRRRLGLRGDERRTPRPKRTSSRWASSAASPWPASSRTKWASARSWRCRACSQRHGLKVDDIDLWELNEAFASQVLYCMDRLGIRPTTRSMSNGGAISIGHPYGMSGARMTGHISARRPPAQAPRWASSPCASAAAWARPACSRSCRLIDDPRCAISSLACSAARRLRHATPPAGGAACRPIPRPRWRRWKPASPCWSKKQRHKLDPKAKPLAIDPELSKIARARASDMAAKNYLAHAAPNGDTSRLAADGGGRQMPGPARRESRGPALHQAERRRLSMTSPSASWTNG